MLYTVISLVGVVFQATILRLPFLDGVFYDLVVPMVVFARLNLSTRTAALLVVIVGFVMDLFSGGQFGLYLSVYFWVFVGVRGISSYFDVQGSLFRSLLIAFCVLFENLVCCVFSVFPGEVMPVLTFRIGTLLWQTFFAAVTGPAIVLGLEKVLRRMETPQQEARKRRQDLAVL